MVAQNMTAAEAKLQVADQDRKAALKALRSEQGRLDRAKASHDRAKQRFDKAVALAVSSKPKAVDWYQHPGPLPQVQVREALSLSTMQLHRLMQRFAKR